MNQPPTPGKPNDVKSALNHLLQKQLWAIGGGKGGVGKSLIASSLAYTLAKLGHSTLAIDLDLGGANLHTVLGQPPPPYCLSDFLSGKVALKDCVVPTPYPNLSLIAGAKDDLRVTEITYQDTQNLMNAIRTLDYSFVILDLGAGTSHYTLDAFNAANVGILGVLPEPTSIENAYRFLKASYFRRIEQDPSLAAIQDLVISAMTPNHPGGIQSPTDLMNEVRRRNPGTHAQLMQSISEFRPKLVLNQTRTQNDVDVGFSMKSVAKKYFGIELDYLGYLEYEPNVWQSVRRMRPILADYPHSRIAAHVERICHYLLKQARTTQAGWHAP